MRRIAAALTVIALSGCGTSRGQEPAASALRPPSCSTAIARPSRRLAIRTAYVATGGSPFGVVTTADGRYSFVAVFDASSRSATGGIVVLADHGLRPTIVRTVPVFGGMPLGLALSHDGRELLAASGSGATVLDVARLETGGPDPTIGQLSAGNLGGAIQVTVSPDDRYAFVSEEDSERIAVFDLATALADHFRRPAYVGSIPTGLAPVGMAISPTGRWMYATSELRGPQSPGEQGSLSVIDLHRAETSPAHSVTDVVDAGCGPVRVVVTPDGATVWVTARESDRLLAFSAAWLNGGLGGALRADVTVGEAPVGLALTGDGQIVVADSNRFDARGQRAMLTVVEEARAAVVGTIATGLFPRELSLEPDGALLVTDFGSDRVEAVDLAASRTASRN